MTDPSSPSAPVAVWADIQRDVVRVEGDDAASYLQGQLSQDVAGLAIGASAPTFVLQPQGKVDGWGRVHRLAADAFEIDVDLGAGAAWDARIRRFLLRTKAEVTLTPDVAALAVRGMRPEGSLDAAWPGVEGGDLLGEAAAAARAEVVASATGVDAIGLEAMRIRAGVPRWGAELDQDTIPATVGQWVIDASVSFTKGCYTGQELVARIDSRGGNVPRHLVGIVVAGGPPPPGTPVVAAGTEVSVVTSAAPDLVDPDRSVALGFVPRALDVGDGVDVEVGGSPARLVSLPMA